MGGKEREKMGKRGGGGGGGGGDGEGKEIKGDGEEAKGRQDNERTP
jgi:hypothetical protein